MQNGVSILDCFIKNNYLVNSKSDARRLIRGKGAKLNDIIIEDENYISNTGITFKIIEDWFTNKDESGQRAVMADICKLLSENNVGFDCNGYPKAPPSFRIWAGGTVQTSDVELVLPWIDWAYSEIKSKYA